MPTPYTIRERRENIAKHSQKEAYPGQREKLLADLIEGDYRRLAEERERAAEARHGGRFITESLARAVADFRGGGYQTVIASDPFNLMCDAEVPVWIAALSGELGPDKLAQCWANMIDPSGRTPESEQRRAQRAAERGGTSDAWDRAPGYLSPSLTVEQAQDMVEWPVYRIATLVLHTFDLD